MRKIVQATLLGGIIIVALLFGGCTINVPALPQSETTVSAEQVQANESNEDMYIEDIEAITELSLTKDEAAIAIDLGWATCSLLDEYDPDIVRGGIFQSMSENDIDPDSRFGQITIASMVVSTYDLCPEYEGAWD